MIMKKFINYLSVLLFILATHGFIYAQDFTVTIESTDAYAHYLPPIKAGGSHQFQIEVKNNRSDTCTVSIDKNSMGIDVSSWVTIDNNSQKIFPSQSKNFLLTINVPAGTCDCDFVMWLYFDAIDKHGNNHPFDYYPQGIIIDNSPPLSPTFSISQTSSTIFVYSWDSWDERSNTYTVWNPSAGTSGIKTYKIDIKNPNGTIAKSITKDFTDYNYYTFNNLNSNTNYKASVTAFDLVGNSRTTEKSATTAPAKPTGLTFSNITYIDATLSWSPSTGATGYNVYKVSGSTNTKLNSSPITTNSYKIEELNPNSTYSFNVIALSNVGPSDRSNNASVTTLTLPGISGSSTICSDEYTYTIQGLVPGYTVSWNNSSNLNKQSSSGSSANFIKISNGAGWIGANIIAPNARVLELSNKNVWVGKPSFYLDGDDELPAGSAGIALVEYAGDDSPYTQGVYDVDWSSAGGLSNLRGDLTKCIYMALIGGPAYIYADATNACGSIEERKAVDVTGGFFMLMPNPSDDYVEITTRSSIEGVNLNSTETNEPFETGTIRIFDSFGMLHSTVQMESKNQRISTSHLKDGVYVVEIKTKLTSERLNLVIKH